MFLETFVLKHQDEVKWNMGDNESAFITLNKVDKLESNDKFALKYHGIIKKNMKN